MRGISVLALLLLSIPAHAAEEPSGSDKFKGNIDHERAALTASDRSRLAPGAELNVLPASGVILSLAAPAEAKLPTPPERVPEDGALASFASFKAAPKAGGGAKGHSQVHQIRAFGETLRAAGLG
jgi:hypothetical protein